MRSCLSICLSVRLRISETSSPTFTDFSVRVANGCGSVLLWQSMLRRPTFGFVDGVFDVAAHIIRSVGSNANTLQRGLVANFQRSRQGRHAVWLCGSRLRTGGEICYLQCCLVAMQTTVVPCPRYRTYVWDVKKVKVAHTWLPSVGFRSWSRFLAVSLQVTWVINPGVGCHYFPPGLHDGCEQFA